MFSTVRTPYIPSDWRRFKTLAKVIVGEVVTVGYKRVDRQEIGTHLGTPDVPFPSLAFHPTNYNSPFPILQFHSIHLIMTEYLRRG